MNAPDILSRLRHGTALNAAEIRWFADALASGEVADAQAGAFAMGVCLSGLGPGGAARLTEAMRDSGHVHRWDLPGPVLDKHSTGGVGDPVSLVLAPALAVAGAYVPMISGRGLGHTGGTLDKLEAIPGFRSELDRAALADQVAALGCVIAGATAELAPADRRLYAIRDVTGTVDCITLITASILSKKLAAGLEGLVLDVKCGSGAFMTTQEDALALARSLTDTANDAGCPCRTLITDMSAPLASAAGNALEVMAAMRCLTQPEREPRLRDVTVALGGELLHLGGLAPSPVAGADRIRHHLDSGAAAERFGQMVEAQGGPPDFLENWADRLPAAPVVMEVGPDQPGHVESVDMRELGEAVLDLGGGRRIETDRVHPAVGLSALAGPGDAVGTERPLALIHAQSQDAAHQVAARVRAAYRLSGHAPAPAPLIMDRIG